MKSLALLCCTILLVNAGVHLEDSSLTTQVGQSCDQNPIFIISSFDVSPYPIQCGSSFTITMTGTYNQGASIGQIQVGLYHNQQWNYQNFNVNTNYAPGQTATYTLQVNTPQYSGSYLVQTTVHYSSGQQYVSCWQFNYGC